MKTALVTGGSRGIGLATALALAEQGFETWIAARQASGLQAACDQASERGLNLHPLSLDVASAESVQIAFATLVREARHPLQVLVHAAGTGAFSQLAHPDDPAHWRQTLDVNLNGAYYCAREAVLQMRSQTWGRLVMISSVLGLRGMRHSHAYCAAKHGVVGLVRGLAQDLIAEGITVNAVCPGWVRTEMGQASMKAIAQHYGLETDVFVAEELRAIPLQRWIEPEEVAAAVMYLVAEQAGAVTGQVHELSGGL